MTHTFLERSELVPVVWTCVIKERIKEIVNWTTSVGKLLLTTLSIWNTINLKNTREFLRSSRFRYRWSSISSIPHNLMWYIFANYGNSPQQDTWLWYLFLWAVNMHSNFCSTKKNVWTLDDDGAVVRGYFEAKFERHLCERECFSSA